MRLKIVLLIAGLVLLSEVFTRVVILRTSKDFVRFGKYPALAQALTQEPGTRVAFIGNSLTQRGVDVAAVTEQLQQRGITDFHANVFVADSSKINTWHFLINQYFWKPRRQPDWFVVHFYEKNLQDGNRVEMGRLSLSFMDTSDWNTAFQLEARSPADRIELVLSSFWATYATRERIRERVLGLAVPKYKDFVSENQALVRRATTTSALEKMTAPEYRALNRLIRTAQANGSRLCFIAFPTQRAGTAPPYAIDPALIARIHEAGMEFVDLRLAPGLNPEHYADDIHLTPEGARIYSATLARALQPLLTARK
jgi:hypothetical protein